MTDSVLIVGAGPVGLLNALGLAQQGIEVTVLESEPVVVASPRAAVYHWSVLAGLDRLGVLKDVEETGFRKQDYLYLVHKTGEQIAFDLSVLEGHTAFPYNVHLGQDALAAIILHHLAALPNVRVLWNHSVTAIEQDAEGVRVDAVSPGGPVSFEAGWVIGADGARSAVRRLLGLDFEGFSWPQRFVATNVYYDFEKHGYARSTLVIDDRFGGIIAKLDRQNLWRVTFSEDASLPEETIAERIPEYYAQRLPGNEPYELVQWSPYTMHQRSAPRYRVDRVLLAGDAAHSTNPTGGLGLTSGLFDTYILCDALAAVAKGEVASQVLDRYAELRRAMFLENASPQAVKMKNLIFMTDTPEEIEKGLANLRRMAADGDFRLERLMFTRKLETPSLLNGVTTEAFA